jgi:putative ABC transport system permease protein
MAVFLGVAFLVGTLVLGDTLASNFDRLFTETTAGTDVLVRNGTSVSGDVGPDTPRGLVDQSLVDRVAAIDGVAAVEAEVTGYGSLLGADGDALGGNGPPRLAGSWITEPELNPYRLVEGRAPEADDEVVVNRGAAEEGDLHVGDRTVVQTPRPIDVTVVGIATFGDTDGLGDVTFTAFTLDAAQANVTGQPDRVSSIVVMGDGTVSDDELRDRVGEVLPGGAEAITGAQYTDEQLESLGFVTQVRTFLVAFALIALLVAALSINNTFTITVAQRVRELALLRSIGATRRQVRRAVLAEAAIVATVAATAGAVAGIGVAVLLKGMFGMFGFALPVGGLEVRPYAIAVGLLVGIGVTLVAARSSARRASSVAPVEALRDAAAESTAVSRRRVVTGAVVLAAGVVLAAVGSAGEGSIPLAGAGAFALVLAALVLAPLALPPVAAVLGGALTRLRGGSGLLASLNARRNPRRSAGTATALTIGVAVVTLFTVFGASASAMIGDDVDGAFGNADLSVSTPVFGGGRLSPEVAGDLDDLDEVEQVVTIADGTVLVDGDRSTQIVGTDLAAAEPVLDTRVRDGSLAEPTAQTLAVSEGTAEDEGWAVGDAVEMTFADGETERMAVGAIVEGSILLGDIAIPADTLFAHTSQPAYRAAFMVLADGVSVDEARSAVTPIADGYGGDVQDRTEFGEAAAQGIDMLLGVVYALLVLAIVIALLGIANTLSLAVHERRHEIGLLRAVGQTQRQARSVLRLESVIVATFGTVLGMAVGMAGAWAVFTALSDGTGAVLPAGSLSVVAVLGVVAGVLAAWRPARRASRLAVLDAIATG